MPNARPPYWTRTRTALWILILAVYLFIARSERLPPFSWIERARARMYNQYDKVLLTRPAFKDVPRYSPEFRYRPATSPVIKKITYDGKVKLHGDYHVPREDMIL